MHELCMMGANVREKAQEPYAWHTAPGTVREGLHAAACAPPDGPFCGRMRDHDDGGLVGNSGSRVSGQS